jgi:monoterpene epsilon-lactone hydrolase
VTAQQREHLKQLLRDAPFDLGGDVAVQRPLLTEMLTAQPLADDVVVTPGELGDVSVLFVEIKGAAPRGTLFHLHGGGFALGSARGSVGLVADLARRTQLRAVSIDYRLAPENPYPAALLDAMTAFRALLEGTESPHDVVVSGESAGGNLAIELLIAAKAQAVPLPRAAFVLSPMTDLTVSGESFVTKAAVDPSISAEAIRARISDYLNGTEATDPRVSPIFADLTGLPPLLIQVGSHEVLLDDATRLASRAAADDVAVILDVTPEVPHVFQAFAGILEEGNAALDRVAAFVASNLSYPAPA